MIRFTQSRESGEERNKLVGALRKSPLLAHKTREKWGTRLADEITCQRRS
jgi:hypothetical protein